jgi:hypothetical protein
VTDGLERRKAEGGRMKKKSAIALIHPSSFLLPPFKVVGRELIG